MSEVTRSSFSLSSLPAIPALLLVLIGMVASRWMFPPVVHAQATDSGHRYVAVTGHYQDGVALLYVLDQKTQRLAVYQAKGGAPNSREVVFVAARDIRLDTLLKSLNDESEYTPDDLEKWFESREIPIPNEQGLEEKD